MFLCILSLTSSIREESGLCTKLLINMVFFSWNFYTHLLGDFNYSKLLHSLSNLMIAGTHNYWRILCMCSFCGKTFRIHVLLGIIYQK
jgi:hypothetical protein